MEMLSFSISYCSQLPTDLQEAQQYQIESEKKYTYYNKGMRYTHVYISDANEEEGYQISMPVTLLEAVQFARDYVYS